MRGLNNPIFGFAHAKGWKESGNCPVFSFQPILFFTFFEDQWNNRFSRRRNARRIRRLPQRELAMRMSSFLTLLLCIFFQLCSLS